MLQGKFSNSQILTKKNELLEIIKRLSHSGVRHENLSETYLKPIWNLCRREGSGRS